MSSYRDLEIYQKAFDLSVKIHRATKKLPQAEQFEIGSQLRRSSMSMKDQIVEGYGRKRYKADFIKFLTYSHSSCDESTSQIASLEVLYPEHDDFTELKKEFEELGRQIHSFIHYVEKNWKT